MSKCPCCEVLIAENAHLREWINRLMEERHPKPPPTLDPRLESVPENDREVLQYGEG